MFTGCFRVFSHYLSLLNILSVCSLTSSYLGNPGIPISPGNARNPATISLGSSLNIDDAVSNLTP